MVEIYKYPTNTGWIAFTPTIAGITIGSEGFFYRRVADSMDIKGSFANSGVSGATLSLTVPAGLSVDAVKMSSTDNSNSHGVMRNLTQLVHPSTVTGPFVAFTNTGLSSVLIYFAKTNSGSRYLVGGGTDFFAVGERGRIDIWGLPITAWRE